MKISVKFRLRSQTGGSTAPLYCRLRIDGQVATDFSTGITVATSKWNQKEQRIRGASAEVQADNQSLENIRTDLKDIFNQLGALSKPRSAQIVRNLYVSKATGAPTVRQAIKQYVAHLRQTHALSTATAAKWRVVETVLTEFLRKALKREEVDFDEFTHEKAVALVDYVRQAPERRWSGNYTAKVIPYFRDAWAWARKKNWTTVDPFQGIHIKREPLKPIIYLEEEHVERLTQLPLHGALANVRDCFLWQCYTGMAYNEVKRFRASEHVAGNLIRIFRGKTLKQNNFPSLIPILPGARQLLEKYPERLPVVNNAAYNELLKGLALAIHFKENLTTHAGRKTAGMYLLNRNVPLETVSRILGHASVKTTERHYARILASKVLRDTAHLMS